MSNNSYKNFDCPVLHDYRYIIDLRPSCEVHSMIRYHNGLYDSNQYRQFMIHNADKLMQNTRQYYTALNGCNSCKFVHVDPNNSEKFFENMRLNMYGEKPYQMPNGKAYIYKQ